MERYWNTNKPWTMSNYRKNAIGVINMATLVESRLPEGIQEKQSWNMRKKSQYRLLLGIRLEVKVAEPADDASEPAPVDLVKAIQVPVA